MRIISGSARRRTLQTPSGDHTRPTPDRVREAIFSMIADYLPQAIVLDCFGGSGALSCEALSRGAAHATVIENNAEAAQCIRINLSLFEPQQSTLIQSDALTVLRKNNHHQRFSLIFIDPPYQAGLYAPILNILPPHCAPNALLVIEHETHHKPTLSNHYTLLKERSFGKVSVIIAEYTGASL